MLALLLYLPSYRTESPEVKWLNTGSQARVWGAEWERICQADWLKAMIDRKRRLEKIQRGKNTCPFRKETGYGKEDAFSWAALNRSKKIADFGSWRQYRKQTWKVRRGREGNVIIAVPLKYDLISCLGKSKTSVSAQPSTTMKWVTAKKGETFLSVYSDNAGISGSVH